MSSFRPNVILLVIMAAIVTVFAMFSVGSENPELIVALGSAFIAGGFAVVKDLVAPVKSDLELVLETFGAKPGNDEGK